MEIKIIKNILAANEAIANENRLELQKRKILALNLMSSPGSGKTSLLDKTLELLPAAGLKSAVIEGDIRTTLDAERLARHGAPIIQINTDTIGGECHLEASMVRAAISKLDLDGVDILFIENVGNLVCPAEFDLGEDRKIALLSATEGEDKPLKYPLMFSVCGDVVITKIDIESILDFSSENAINNIRQVNPRAGIIRVSAKTGEGMGDWIALLQKWSCEKKADAGLEIL